MKGKITLTPTTAKAQRGWTLTELAMSIEIATGDRYKYETCYQGELLSVKIRTSAMASSITDYVHPLNIEKRQMVPLPKKEEEVDVPDELVALVNDFMDRRNKLERALATFMVSKWKGVESKLKRASKIRGVKPLETCLYPVVLTE